MQTVEMGRALDRHVELSLAHEEQLTPGTVLSLALKCLVYGLQAKILPVFAHCSFELANVRERQRFLGPAVGRLPSLLDFEVRTL